MYHKIYLKYYRNNDVREVEIARLSDPGLRQHSPIIYHTINDPAKV